MVIINGEATLESIVNRIYYTMFFGVNALLIIKVLSSSKYSEVRTFFNKEVVIKELLERRGLAWQMNLSMRSKS